jgi:tRNA(adenine34) deaminase
MGCVARDTRSGKVLVMADDERWMGEALAVAEHGLNLGELPIGAVVVVGGKIVGSAHTQERGQRRLLVHAELLALDESDRVPGLRRSEATLYTTVEPCLMCMGAAMTMRVGRVVYALPSDTDGTARFVREWDRQRDRESWEAYRVPAISEGVLAAEASQLFRRFIATGPADDPLRAWARHLLPGA